MEQPTVHQPHHSTPPSAPDMVSQNSSETEVSTVDVLAAKDLVVGLGYHYLDVRTAEEFEKGHVDVEKTANIPYMFATPEGRVKNPKFLEQVTSLYRKEDRIVVGCQSGVRSLYAATDLLGAGFKDVKNMGGGYIAWVENALATRKPQVATDEAEAEAEAEAAAEL